MTISAESLKRKLGEDTRLQSAVGSMEAAAIAANSAQRRRLTNGAGEILEITSTDAARNNDVAHLYTADTLQAIAVPYGFQNYFRAHRKDRRYVGAFTEFFIAPAQQEVHKIGRATTDAFTTVDLTLKQEVDVSPNLFLHRKQRHELAQVLAYQAGLLQCLDPENHLKFAQLPLPDYIKADVQVL